MPSQAYMQRHLSSEAITVETVKHAAKATVQASLRTAAKHAGSALLHTVEHAELVSSQIKEHKSTTGAKQHLSIAACHAVKHGKQAIAHAKDQLHHVGHNLKSENPTERAVGGVQTVVAGAVAGGVAAIAADFSGFVLRSLFTYEVPTTDLSIERAADERVNAANEASYWQTFKNWAPLMLMVGGTLGAYVAVKCQHAARSVGSFFAGERDVYVGPAVEMRQVPGSAEQDSTEVALDGTKRMRL